MKKQFLIVAIGSASLLLGFQNCGSKFQFKDSNGVSAATKILPDDLSNHILVTDNSGPTNPSLTTSAGQATPTPNKPPSGQKNACKMKPENEDGKDKDKDGGDKSKTQSKVASLHADKDHAGKDHVDKDHEEKDQEGDERLCKGEGKEKDNDDNDKDDDGDKKLVECMLLDKKIVLASKDSVRSDPSAPKTKVCMSKNACLNIVNQFAHPRNCELVKDIASNASGKDCTEDSKESGSSCKDAAALTDDDVKNLLSNLPK